VALWLFQEVGEGGVFSKADLRSAFPGTEQIDRRMRELRQEGWSIATYREDRSLSHDQLRLLEIGGRVWQKGYVSPTTNSTTDKQRAETLAADGYACRVCGIAAGETYPEDSLQTAKLAAERYQGEAGAVLLRTVCDRCLSGRRPTTLSANDLLDEIASLDKQSRHQLAEWLALGHRTATAADRIWGKYLSMPEEIRIHIAREITGVGR
jgi:hypothetical protein